MQRRLLVFLSAATLVFVLAGASSASAVTPQAVRRFCNLTNGSHFYSASGQECADVLANFSSTFRYEGIAWTIDTDSPAATAPLYRFCNLTNNTHFYTASEAEKNNLIANFSSTYRFEGVAYKVSVTTGAPVYRFYKFSPGCAFYTISAAERDSIIANWPTQYRYEGIAFYVPTTAPRFNADIPWSKTNSTWPLYRVYVNYSSLPSAWRDVVYRSRMQWNDAGASNMYFYYDANASGAHQIQLIWNPVGKPGETTFTVMNGSLLVDADTFINEARVAPGGPVAPGGKNPPMYDGQSVATHELGHWVAEFDSNSQLLAPELRYLQWMTMNYQANYDTAYRTLAAEDIDGIRYLYGAKRLAASGMEGARRTC